MQQTSLQLDLGLMFRLRLCGVAEVSTGSCFSEVFFCAARRDGRVLSGWLVESPDEGLDSCCGQQSR